MSLHDVVSRIVSVLHAHGHLIDEERDQFLKEIAADRGDTPTPVTPGEGTFGPVSSGFAHPGYQQFAPPTASATAAEPQVDLSGGGSGSD